MKIKRSAAAGGIHAILRFLVYAGFVIFAGYPWSIPIALAQVFIGLIVGLVLGYVAFSLFRDRWAAIFFGACGTGLIGALYTGVRTLGHAELPTTVGLGLCISFLLWGCPMAFAIWMAASFIKEPKKVTPSVKPLNDRP